VGKCQWRYGGQASSELEERLGLSLVLPGLGQIYVHKIGLALFFSLAQMAISAASIWTRALYSFRGLVAFVVMGMAIAITSIAHAAWIGLHQEKGSELPQVSKFPLIVALAVAGVNFAGNVSGFLFNRLPIGPFVMSSESGAPALKVRDRVVVDPHAYGVAGPRRGDLIVFELDKTKRVAFQKRVIALGGDVIEGTSEGISVNGKVLNEPYLAARVAGEDDTYADFPPHTVAAGCIYVMGDNRVHSYDSREFGDVRLERVIGKVLYIYWSKDHSRIGRDVE
jgi:signal peptidase I